MPFLLPPIVIQVLLVIHVVKTGRERYWIYILLFVPVAGGIAYLLIELLPEFLSDSNVRNAKQSITRIVNPGRELTELEARTRRSATVSNMTELANAYLGQGRNDEAIELYERCLAGPFANDPELILNLARAHARSARPHEALEVLAKLDGAPAATRPETLILAARVHDELGNTDEAGEAFRRASEVGAGLEYAYWHGEFLLRSGKRNEAYDVFNEMIESYKAMPSFARKTNRQWINLVEQAMKVR